MSEPSNTHIVYRVLPPIQMEHPEPIKYKCSLCNQDVPSFLTSEHATEHDGVESYELDNIGLHISVEPTEHTPDFEDDTNV